MRQLLDALRLSGYGAFRRLRNLTFAAILALPAVAEAENVTVVALGDSLTHGYGLPPDEGFVPRLQAWLDRNGVAATVVNAGVSGDTTAGGLERADWALSEDADAVIVELGGNDMLRGLDPAEARKNLAGILEKAKAKGMPVLLAGLAAPPNYGTDYKAAFDAIWPDLSQSYGTLLYEDFLRPVKEAMNAGRPMSEVVQQDGIHPSAAGVDLIVEGIGPSVRELVARAAGG